MDIFTWVAGTLWHVFLELAILPKVILELIALPFFLWNF